MKQQERLLVACLRLISRVATSWIFSPLRFCIFRVDLSFYSFRGTSRYSQTPIRTSSALRYCTNGTKYFLVEGPRSGFFFLFATLFHFSIQRKAPYYIRTMDKAIGAPGREGFGTVTAYLLVESVAPVLEFLQTAF